jgi:hypothetical protein
MDEPRRGVAGGRITLQEPAMPKDQDFKRLVRARMDHTGERYTQARAALVAERAAPDPLVSDRTRSVLGQLANVGVAELSRRYLERLPEPQRRAAAIEGLHHQDWRVRRTSALLLDRADLTAESAAALIRALDDEHPQVRRKAVHSLSCEQCKPNGCVVDIQPLFERVIRDRSRLVRSWSCTSVRFTFSTISGRSTSWRAWRPPNRARSSGRQPRWRSATCASGGSPMTAVASCRPIWSGRPNATQGDGSLSGTGESPPSATAGS